VTQRSIRRAVLLAAVPLLGAPQPLLAHAVTTGMGPFYDGAAHLLLTPEDAVIVVAMALYAGLRGVASGRAAMFLLPAAWFVGGVLGDQVGAALPIPLPAVSFLLIGALVAGDVRLSPRWVAGLAAGIGMAHGYANGVAFRGAGAALELVGVASLTFVVVALLAALVVSLTQAWARIAVRVVGSWVAASGLLLLGWALR